MGRWLKILLFAILLGVVKAHHFIRVVILAGLGLAGLWMVHTLAQDFNTIQSGGSLSSLGALGSLGSLSGLSSLGNNNNNNDNNNGVGVRDIFKRSIPENKVPQINWETVLSRDPASCARSFLCQLAATEKKLLSTEEQQMLYLVRISADKDNWASKQLQEALKSGEKALKPSQCMKIYKYCPYTSQMMMTLLRVFGR